MTMTNYLYLGDFSATPPWYSVSMQCHDCKVSWVGCWDNFECPKCGKGELPDLSLEKAMLDAAPVADREERSLEATSALPRSDFVKKDEV